ncbi:hypothetical protein Taro_035745, partial [Colocasia esculenta]|nr:hypothetical protein [Colocasia esculenta]
HTAGVACLVARHGRGLEGGWNEESGPCGIGPLGQVGRIVGLEWAARFSPLQILILPFPLDCLYADPDRKAYDALGLYYGLGRTFFNRASAKVFSRIESLQKAMKNYTISATPDDRSSVLQQGGMFIFKGKQLLYARKDEGTGDHAALDDILNLCCKAPAA